MSGRPERPGHDDNPVRGDTGWLRGEARDRLPIDSDRPPADDEPRDESPADNSPADDPATTPTRTRRPPTARHGRFRPTVLAAVAVGGAAGTLARYGVGLAVPASTDGFPWATLAVNVTGAWLLAFLLVLVAERLPPSPYWRPLLGTGFCGGYTTFSTFAVESDVLVMHHHPATAGTYVVATVVAGVGAAYLGLFTGRAVVQEGRR